MANTLRLGVSRPVPLVPLVPVIDSAKQAIHLAIASNAGADSLVITAPKLPPASGPIPDSMPVMSTLVDEDFPFDESQLAAIDGMCNEQFACITGAAGTGKTTTTKRLVDQLLVQNAVSGVDMTQYWKSAYAPDDDADDYEMPESNWVPSVCLVGFTGRSTQMIKRGFPRDWHGNIMTIHRMLGYAPEFFDKIDESTNELRRTKRFIPTYTADCLLPWDIIIIDEAGMVSLNLWQEILAAAKQSARIYMIGDINQLPPIHGRPIFGFAMAKWPTWELTHIHRQTGDNNAIVENAWRVLKGERPIDGGNFKMIPLKGDAQYASRQVRAMMPKLRAMKLYEPNRDAIITPINGEDGARGYALGQLPLNREFALMFNPADANPRFIIDAGIERKQFAVGDKVMATRNDHEAGVTNGMTGIITDIAPNGAYCKDSQRFGIVSDVNAYFLCESDPDAGKSDEDDFSLESITAALDAEEANAKAKKEKRDRGPSSHIVTVRFGDAEHGFEIAFATLSEVGTLMTAYVVTCHKMQGGEAPTVVIICHDSHRMMMFREWLYTAITRASQLCILLYAPDALRTALSKQKIKGSTLAEKVRVFNALYGVDSIQVALPKARKAIIVV